MHRKIIGAACLAAMSLLAASCTSGPHGRHGPPGRGYGPGRDGAERPSVVVRPGALLLIDLDANRDLQVTRAELDAGTPVLFAEADTNHNGEISPLEFDAFMKAHVGVTDSAPGRLSFDVNADNIITPAEFAAGMKALFDRYDADHDGIVTRAELVQRLDIGGPGERAEGAPDQSAPPGMEHRRRGP